MALVSENFENATGPGTPMTNSMKSGRRGNLLLAPHRASPARRPCCSGNIGTKPLGLRFTLDVVHATAFLLSGAAQWITGSALGIDGRFTAQ